MNTINCPLIVALMSPSDWHPLHIPTDPISVCFSVAYDFGVEIFSDKLFCVIKVPPPPLIQIFP